MTEVLAPTRRAFAAALAACALLAAPSAAWAQSESERLNAFFEAVYQRDLARSPIMQSRRGIKTDQRKWDEISEAHRVEEAALTRQDLKTLHGFDYEALPPQDRRSYDFFEWSAERSLESFKWRRKDYLISQMGGMHTRVPVTLQNNHPIDTRDDAEDYIARLRGVKPLMEQFVIELKRQEGAGVQPPRFVYPLVIGPAENVIAGAPFDDSGEDSPLWADFKAKIAATDLPATDKAALTEQARTALLEGVQAGYEHLIAHLREAGAKATGEDGVWKLPGGEAFYRSRLEAYTTLPLTAGEIHELGLREVAAIHDQMRGIMEQVGFEGSLQDFFEFMRTDERFYYPDSEDGRAAYLAEAQRLLTEIQARADELLGVRPSAPVEARAVEEWREDSAAKAFYDSPPQDGARPGIFYVNLADMQAQPKYQLPVILYHEAVPGHHVETVIAYELEGLPKFRKFASIGAFSEGWGLYSERLPKEIGLYQDPYADFGRLSLSLMRAVRLVVDTGIHAKRWSREEAVAYMDVNMPSSHYDNQREIDRYIVLPGQATSYYIGMMKILELRERAKTALGEDFDIRDFHDVVLGAGPVPLPMLENSIESWIAAASEDKR